MTPEERKDRVDLLAATLLGNWNYLLNAEIAELMAEQLVDAMEMFERAKRIA
mgnify:CR=1 FL=1